MRLAGMWHYHEDVSINAAQTPYTLISAIGSFGYSFFISLINWGTAFNLME